MNISMNPKPEFGPIAAHNSSFPRTSEKLCSACRKIDWFLLAARLEPSPPEYERMEPILFGGRRGLESQHCALCQILFETVVLSHDLPKAIALSSTAQALRRDVNSGIPSTMRWTTWFLTEKRHFAVSKAGPRSMYRPRIINPTSIDIKVIQGWLRKCSYRCSESIGKTGASTVAHLRVIDCVSKTIIKAPPECSYVALSYVWGDSRPAQPSLSPGKFPATINDSMTFCIALGFQYLWVDFYCIDQKESSHRIDQIAQMDRIYSEASLTIIAAAGEGSNYGLPGVGVTPRRPQRQIQIGPYTVVEIYPYITDNLKHSRWATRAWTFQEGYLSRRRIIFTGNQVSFVCGCFYAVESLTHTTNHSSLTSALTLSNIFGNCLNSWKGYETVGQYLPEYSARAMTFESDALNACLGILRHFQAQPVHDVETHLWGTIVNRSNTRLALDWYHIMPSARRLGFPSWSWTGWRGKAESAFETIPNLRSRTENTVVVKVSENSKWILLEEYLHLKSMNTSLGRCADPKCLELTGQCPSLQFVYPVTDDHGTFLLPVRFDDDSPVPEEPIEALLTLTTTVSQRYAVYFDDEISDLRSLQGFVAMLIHHCEYLHSPYVLLLFKLTGAVYSRIGLLAKTSSLHDLAICDRPGTYRAVRNSSVELGHEFRRNSEIRQEPLWLQEAMERTIIVE